VLLRANDGRWLPALQYREQQLPADIRLRLHVEVNLLEPDTPVRGKGPQLLVLSNDEISPFTLRLEQRLTPVLSLHSDGLEEVRIETL
jgi:general secretion pathway protein H